MVQQSKKKSRSTFTFFYHSTGCLSSVMRLSIYVYEVKVYTPLATRVSAGARFGGATTTTAT